MKYFLVVSLVCFIGLNNAFGQQGGAQILRLAQSVYEQGRLHELPALLKDSEVAKFSKEEQVRAYRLLTLAYIYLEEPEKADESMLKLLNTDHFFEPSDQIDPAEFMGLYRTFRTKPVYNFGLKFGVNGTQPLVNSAYYVSGNAPGKGTYNFGIGFQVGLVFEKEILTKWKNKVFGNGRLLFAPEAFYTNRTFKYTNTSLFLDDGTGASDADIKATVKQSWIDLNPIVQLKMGKSKTFFPYFGFGPGVSFLIGAPNTLVMTRTGGAGVVSGPDVPFAASYNKLIPSLTGLAGLKYRFGAIYLVAEFRIQYGLTNPVKSAARTNVSGAFDYNFQLSNYHPVNVIANIGFVIPYFKPIKLKRK